MTNTTQSDGWKFKAHLAISKGHGKSIRMEIKPYKTETMYREIGPGQPIYYISSYPENFDSEEKLMKFIDKQKKF